MEMSVNFSEIMHFFRRSWVKFLLVVLAFGIVCGLLPLKLIKFSYSANTTLTFVSSLPENADMDYREQYTSILNSRVQTALAEAGSNDLILRTAAKLGVDKGSICKITADQLKGAPVIKLTVQTTDGDHAAEISDTAAQLLADQITQQFPSPKLTASITDKALETKTQSHKSSMVKAGVLGLILGFIVYVCYGLICVLSDRSVRNGAYAAELIKIRFFGEIPHDSNSTARADAFRKTRAAVTHQLSGMKRFAVFSVNMNDGGCEAAAGFADSLAKAGNKVLLVDADLRDPKLAASFGIKVPKTLNDVLAGSCTVKQAAADVPNHAGLSLLGGAQLSESPADLFARGFTKLTADADSDYDYVIIYAPSELTYPDADSLAGSVQAVILTAKYGSTTYVSLRDSVKSTQEAGGNVAGFIVTDA